MNNQKNSNKHQSCLCSGSFSVKPRFVAEKEHLFLLLILATYTHVKLFSVLSVLGAINCEQCGFSWKATKVFDKLKTTMIVGSMCGQDSLNLCLFINWFYGWVVGYFQRRLQFAVLCEAVAIFLLMQLHWALDEEDSRWTGLNYVENRNEILYCFIIMAIGI